MRRNQHIPHSYGSALRHPNNIQNDAAQVGLTNDEHFVSSIFMSNPSQPRDMPKTANEPSFYENCPPPSYDELFPPIPTGNCSLSVREIRNISGGQWTPSNPQISTSYGFRVPNALSRSFGSISISTPPDLNPEDLDLIGTPLSIEDQYLEFDTKNDAEILFQALNVPGEVDENVITNLLARKSFWQRRKVSMEYERRYGKHLIEDLKLKLFGDFEDLIVVMMTPLPEFYARELTCSWSDIILMVFFCTLPNLEVQNIRRTYELMNGKSLEWDLKNRISGDFKEFMISFCFCNRDENDVDEEAAMNDAKILLSSGILDIGTDNSAFKTILLQRSFPQLKAIFQQYEFICGHNIERRISEEYSGDFKNFLLAMVQCIENRAVFYAQEVHKCKRGLVMDYHRLTRIIVPRCEIDIREIKRVFCERYGESLESFINEIPGHYQTCLSTLISRS